MQIRGRIAVILATAACVVSPATPVFASTAHEFQLARAAAPCSGSACDGKDPEIYCGGDARTARQVQLGGALLELRYSPSCRAAWARISSASWTGGSKARPLARVVRNSDGRTYTCFVPSGGTSCYTMMVNDANVTSYATGLWDDGTTVYADRTGSYL
jgi:hypothetical protein